jgi:hypothetical protein
MFTSLAANVDPLAIQVLQERNKLEGKPRHIDAIEKSDGVITDGKIP